MDLLPPSVPLPPHLWVHQALSAMVKLELPHINVLTKVDLAPDRAALDQFLVPDPDLLQARCV